MTNLAASWKKTARRHPYALSIIMLTLWCIQLLHWGRWEFRRKPIKKAPPLPQAIAQETDVHIEPPILMADPHNIPASPFITHLQINQGSDSNSEFQRLHELEVGTPLPIVDPPKIDENPTPVALPKNPAETLGALRYRGFMQTTRGVRVAFIEDKTAQRIIRIQVGDDIEGWELAAITRDRIILTAEKEPPFEILRDSQEAELAPEDTPQQKAAAPEADEPETANEALEKENSDP